MARGVEVPAALRCELLHQRANLAGQVGAELDVGDRQVVDELLGQHGDVVLVHQRVDQLQRAAADGHVRVLDAAHDHGAVALHRLRVHRHHLGQRVERHVPDVVIVLLQKLSQHIDGQHAQPADGLHTHDGHDALVQHGITRILACVCVGGHLRQDIAHVVAGIAVALPKDAQQPQHLNLQEGVVEPPAVVLGAVVRAHQVLEHAHQGGHLLAEEWHHLRVRLTQLSHQCDAADEHAMVAVIQKLGGGREEVVQQLGNAAQHAHRRQRRLLADERIRRAHQLLNLGRQVARHLRRADVTQRSQRQPHHKLIRAEQVVLHAVGHQHENLLPLVQQHHQRQVPDTLVRVAAAGDQLDAFHLPEVRRVAQHVDVHQLGHIAVPHAAVIAALERRAQRCALLGDGLALLRGRLAGAHRADQVAQLAAHGCCPRKRGAGAPAAPLALLGRHGRRAGANLGALSGDVRDGGLSGARRGGGGAAAL
mmetsp:Transcript_19600/g.60889  ORF Transcript_19600/g.60889 Transcript_19600/m.60889 type:complete len:479 (-) Transcript_19600:1-1437(-)